MVSAGVEELGGASWLPDSRHFLFAGSVPAQGTRVFAQDAEGGPARPITPEGSDLDFPVVSRDGRVAAARAPDGIAEFPTEGGPLRSLAGAEPGEVPIQWSSDGRLLFVFKPGELPGRIFSLNVATGQRLLWKQIEVADPTGVAGASRAGRGSLSVAMTSDAKSYAYSFGRQLSELYLVEGLR